MSFLPSSRWRGPAGVQAERRERERQRASEQGRRAMNGISGKNSNIQHPIPTNGIGTSAASRETPNLKLQNSGALFLIVNIHGRGNIGTRTCQETQPVFNVTGKNSGKLRMLGRER